MSGDETGTSRRGRGGFTLIEMLVVVAIISILAGLTLVGVQAARKYGNEKAAAIEVQMLCARLQSVASAFGDFPPTSLADLKVKGNGVNEGNESLFAFLLSKKHGGPFADDLREDRWRNFDADEAKGNDVKTIQSVVDWVRGNNQLLEYVDFWGSPFIYIHSRDYGKKFKYQGEEGAVFEVEARKSPATGTYYAPTTFQLWSLGADTTNQNGDGDDIVSWK
ncbi:MAG TPA: type II secretion system protein [Planctomycetota bacterium]|nr:type II secretion system protein [Planctomycetota bacterium]